jgi:hypothetical protein
MPTNEWAKVFRRDPHARAVKEALLDLEERAHLTGWDAAAGRPVLFTTYSNVSGGLFEYYMNRDLTRSLQMGHAHCDDVGQALTSMANLLVDLRQNGMPGGQGKGPTPAGQDLTSKDDTGMWQFHGLILLWEGWGITEYEGVETGLPRPEPGKLHEHPARMEYRQANMVDRNGQIWNLERRRSTLPIVNVWAPDDPDGPTGSVLHGLSRVVDAWCGVPVPIVSEVS